jgi:hypothetical protein
MLYGRCALSLRVTLRSNTRDGQRLEAVPFLKVQVHVHPPEVEKEGKQCS